MEFIHIKKEIEKKYKQKTENALKLVKVTKTIDEINKIFSRETGRSITHGKQTDVQKTKEKVLKDIKNYYIKKKEKVFSTIDNISKADRCTSFCLYIEWTKGGIYGMQAKATLQTGISYIEGKRTSGCGYDKRSTAAAYALNKAPEILRALYELEEKRLSKREKLSRRDYIGYGCFDNYNNNYYLPEFETGVGIYSQIDILKRMGYEITYDETRYTDIIKGE